MIEHIISLGLKHRLLAVVLAVSVCGLGIGSLSRLPIDAFPDISPNLVQVFAEVDGMAPEEVEQLVTRPTEAAMRSIPGVKLIRSLSSLGLSTVNVYFEDDVDVYRARQLVSERLRLAEEGIPEGIDMPHGLEMGPVASGMGKILAYYLEAGGRPLGEVRMLHEFVVKRGLEGVPGVAKIVSQGGYLRQFEVELAPEKLIAYNLTVTQVCEAIARNNANVGAGLITRGSEELIVRSLGRLQTDDDIANTLVTNRDGKAIFVRDVATVRIGHAFRRGVAILGDGREIVAGGVYKIHRANSFEVIGALRQRIAEINQTLPDDIRIVTFYDQSELVANSIKTVTSALQLGLILITVVAFVFLGTMRNALIMVCSLPFALLMGLSFMEQSAVPGDLISFGGMAIALGMIIDATIIMVEKLQTALLAKPETADPQSVIETAAHEVGRPIVFAVAVIAIVFLPIFTLGEIEGKMFRPLAFAVVSTMLGSLLYALLVAPVFFLLVHKQSHTRRTDKQKTVMGSILAGYEAAVRWTLDHSKLMTVAALALMVVGGWQFHGLGREFIPTLQEGTINCLAHMNPNVSLDEIKKMCAKITAVAREIPEIENVVADIGYGEVGPHMHHTNYGCMTLTVKPRGSMPGQRSQAEIVSALEKKLEGHLGVSISFSQPIAHELDGLISGSGAQVVMKIFGSNMLKLKSIASVVEHAVENIDGVADLRVEQTDGQTQLQIDLEPNRLARHGLDKQSVQAYIRQSLTGEVAGTIIKGETNLRILVRLDRRYQENRRELARLLIPTPSGSYVPLGSLAKIGTVTGLRQISRENTQRYISVQCNVRGRDVGGFVEEAQRAVQAVNALPPGYRISWGGQFELHQAANERLRIVIPITLALVLLLLYSLFDSARMVLLIILNIPLALVGGALALARYGECLSIPSSIGFIALFGIALTDGIVLLTRFEKLRHDGTPLVEAIISGCRSKFRPVLMTTITTALGLFPLIIAQGAGSEVQRPLAIVVVFGLATSTIVTLFAIPAGYLWLERTCAHHKEDEPIPHHDH